MDNYLWQQSKMVENILGNYRQLCVGEDLGNKSTNCIVFVQASHDVFYSWKTILCEGNFTCEKIRLSWESDQSPKCNYKAFRMTRRTTATFIFNFNF